MKKHKVKRMVFSSSATVYGEPQYLPINESHVTGQRVTNPYGRTKYFIEEILRDLCSSDPVGIVSALFSPILLFLIVSVQQTLSTLHNQSIECFTILPSILFFPLLYSFNHD